MTFMIFTISLTFAYVSVKHFVYGIRFCCKSQVCLYSSLRTVRGSYDGTRSIWSYPSFEARFAYRKSSIHSFTHTLIHSFLVLCVLGSQWENSLSLPLRLHTLQICLCWLPVAACLIYVCQNCCSNISF